MKGYFITGTDTDVGKTVVSLCLIQHFKSLENRVACMKPISAGCYSTEDGLRNEDAVRLQQASSPKLPYELINPYAYEPPIAPHIAAEKQGVVIDKQHIKSCYQKIAAQSDLVIIEGAGGWLVPVSDRETMADIAAELQLPVILVVGLRLGCLNHALLTTSSIEHMGLHFTGWIANHLDPDMLNQQDNIESLQRRITAPLLGTVAYQQNIQQNPYQIALTEQGREILS